MTKPPRKRKTPRERAEQALAVVERRVKLLTSKHAEHKAALAVIDTELTAAIVRRDYLAQSPDLPQPARDPKPPTTKSK